jgi:hypothetical protein
MLVIPHRFKKIGLRNLVVRRIFSDILLVLGLKKVEKHWFKGFKRSFILASFTEKLIDIVQCLLRYINSGHFCMETKMRFRGQARGQSLDNDMQTHCQVTVVYTGDSMTAVARKQLCGHDVSPTTREYVMEETFSLRLVPGLNNEEQLPIQYDS